MVAENKDFMVHTVVAGGRLLCFLSILIMCVSYSLFLFIHFSFFEVLRTPRGRGDLAV